MSYILEALKKSEQKRRQDSVPDLLTVHDGGPPRPVGKAWWRYALTGILLVSVGAVLPMLYAKYSGGPGSERIKSTQSMSVTEKSTQSSLQTRSSDQINQVPRARQTNDAKPLKTVRKNELKRDNAFAEGMKPSSKQATLRESDLPAPVQNEMPKFEISAHVYDADPAARIISIHGNIVHEGENISSGVRLENITPDGIILSFKGYRFYKPLF